MSDTTAAQTAMAAIEAAGWSTEGGTAAVKNFDSAVGPKKALIWVSRHPDQEGNITVSGEFWSEGRNIVESNGLLLNVEMSIGQIPRRIEHFLKKLEVKIRDSYAVRLLES